MLEGLSGVTKLDEVLSCFSLKRYKKKQFIIQPGFVAQHRNYVAEGAIQAYVIDDKGIDHTIQLVIADCLPGLR
jgi:hypothetical protein